MGCLHGFEIPFTLDIPSVLVCDKVTLTDKLMGDLASVYWAQFGKAGDPNDGDRPQWPRYDPSVDRQIHFTSAGVIVRTDTRNPRLDLSKRVWSGGQ